MEKTCKQEGLTLPERRRFLKLSAEFGFTAAIVALSKGALGQEEASAQVVRKEAELKAAAAFSTRGLDVVQGETRSGARSVIMALSLDAHGVLLRTSSTLYRLLTSCEGCLAPRNT